MKHYAAFIAPIDDYDGTAEDLPTEWQNANEAVHIYDFSVPEGFSNEMVVLIARGIFWEADWSREGTVSTVVEDITDVDELEDDAPGYEEVNDLLEAATEAMNPVKDFAQHVEIRKAQAARGTSLDVTYKASTQEMSEAQAHDPFDLPEEDDVTGHPV